MIGAAGGTAGTNPGRRGFGRILGLALAAFTVVACTADDGTGDDEAPGDEAEMAAATAQVVQDSALRAAVVAEAQPVAGALMQTLSGQLRSAMEEGGPVGAMEFCNVQALPLTRQVSREQGMTVGRTSLRLRNPDNAPDAAATAALALFAERTREAGTVPDPLVQRLPDGDYRFYQPLMAQPLCTSCHGAPDALAPGVADALARLYPDDRATGYLEGDWRGLLHVTVPAAEVAGQ